MIQEQQLWKEQFRVLKPIYGSTLDVLSETEPYPNRWHFLFREIYLFPEFKLTAFRPPRCLATYSTSSIVNQRKR